MTYRIGPVGVGARAARHRPRVRRRRGCDRSPPWWPVSARDPGAVDAALSSTPLERALDLALRADGGDSPDRRRALERVARELGSAGRSDLADEARALAWYPPRRAPSRSRGLRLAPAFSPSSVGQRERIRPPPADAADCRPRRQPSSAPRHRRTRASAPRSRVRRAGSSSAAFVPRAVLQSLPTSYFATGQWRHRRARPVHERRRPEGRSALNASSARSPRRRGVSASSSSRTAPTRCCRPTPAATSCGPCCRFFDRARRISRDTRSGAPGGGRIAPGVPSGAAGESPWSLTFRGGTRISTGPGRSRVT